MMLALLIVFGLAHYANASTSCYEMAQKYNLIESLDKAGLTQYAHEYTCMPKDTPLSISECGMRTLGITYNWSKIIIITQNDNPNETFNTRMLLAHELCHTKYSEVDVHGADWQKCISDMGYPNEAARYHDESTNPEKSTCQ